MADSHTPESFTGLVLGGIIQAFDFVPEVAVVIQVIGLVVIVGIQAVDDAVIVNI